MDDREAQDVSQPEQAHATGYLDGVLAVFQRHNHPFILIGSLAMRWSGANSPPEKEIDVLVRTSQLTIITNDLTGPGDWVPCPNPYKESWPYWSTTLNTTHHTDAWLRSRCQDFSGFLGCNFIRLWPEELYHMSVDNVETLEVPDVFARVPVLLEDEYYRDPYQRFGPKRQSRMNIKEKAMYFPTHNRSKSQQVMIPIYIPRIKNHVDALLDQNREEVETGTKCGNWPLHWIEKLVDDHVWDWLPASQWLLDKKLRQCDHALMTTLLERSRRTRKPKAKFGGLGNCGTHGYPWGRLPDPKLLQTGNDGDDERFEYLFDYADPATLA